MRDTEEIVRQLVATKKWGEIMVRIAERAGYRCEYCNLDLLASPENYKLWERDHIIPKSSGGTDGFENLALSCRHCNVCWKGRWNPAMLIESAASRDTLIAAARAYIQEQRALTQTEIDHVRQVVGYPNDVPPPKSPSTQL